MWSRSCAGYCTPLHSAACCSPASQCPRRTRHRVFPVLLDPDVSGGEYKQNKSCITQDPQICWGEIFTVESFEVPFFVKNQLAAFYTSVRARGDLALTLCPLRDQKALTSLQQCPLTIAGAHSLFSCLIEQ